MKKPTKEQQKQIAEAKKRDLEYRKNIAKIIRYMPKYEA